MVFQFVFDSFYRLHRPGPNNNSGDDHGDDDDDRDDGDGAPRVSHVCSFVI
jgi:hypothetical protein